MKDLYLATYSFGTMNLTIEEMTKTAKELGFQGLEFLMPLTVEHSAALKAHGMKIIDSMEGPAADGSLRNIDLLHALGVKYVAGTSLVSFGNRQQALWAAERLNRAGRALQKEGLKLFYHNHTHEWRREQDEYLVETLLNNTDPDWVCLQMDAGWAACAGIDPIAFVKQHPGRVELMHVKASTGILGPEGVPFMAPPPDGDGSFHLSLPEPGTSGEPLGPAPEMLAAMERIKSVSGAMKDCIIDYQALMAASEENGCKAFILERDEHHLDNPIDCIREDISVLREFW
ncbi:MAG: sugar phosphate isomerase/epimerase [Oscillospiraceae bacterium]|nr:sugar phosphate isomerase/epimerase [Oscillospiraceae bacterium]